PVSAAAPHRSSAGSRTATWCSTSAPSRTSSCTISLARSFTRWRATTSTTRVDVTGELRVIATAGHVDHGKSSLIMRLTGMDPDRWAEEKRRGLTIDLGYAWCTLPDRKSTRLNSSHLGISYAVFCLK